MTNSQCPSCQEEIETHEAGRCLDKLIAKVKGLKVIGEYNGNPYTAFSQTTQRGEFYGETEFIDNYTFVPHYSTDLNHAIKLGDPEWIQFRRTMPRTGAEPGDILINGINADREWVITDWDRVESMLADHFSNLDTEDDKFVIAKGSTLTLARCRAFLIEKLEDK